MSNFKSTYPFIYSEQEVDEDGDDFEDDVNLNFSEKDQFVQDYGVYMEMIYIVCGGDLLKMDEVFKLTAHKFLFISEYLIRKRNIETKKPTKAKLLSIPKSSNTITKTRSQAMIFPKKSVKIYDVWI